jgi:hypothetical protein
MNARVYEQITERIIALLAQGTVPWCPDNQIVIRLSQTELPRAGLQFRQGQGRDAAVATALLVRDRYSGLAFRSNQDRSSFSRLVCV